MKNEGQVDWLPGSGGVLDSFPPTKIHPKRDQGPDDTSIWRRTRGGQGGVTEDQRDPWRTNHPEDDRDLDAGQGKQRGGVAHSRERKQT